MTQPVDPVALLIAGAGLTTDFNTGRRLVYCWSPSEVLRSADKWHGVAFWLDELMQNRSLERAPGRKTLKFEVAERAALDAKTVLVSANESHRRCSGMAPAWCTSGPTTRLASSLRPGSS